MNHIFNGFTVHYCDSFPGNSIEFLPDYDYLSRSRGECLRFPLMTHTVARAVLEGDDPDYDYDPEDPRCQLILSLSGMAKHSFVPKSYRFVVDSFWITTDL